MTSTSEHNVCPPTGSVNRHLPIMLALATTVIIPPAWEAMLNAASYQYPRDHHTAHTLYKWKQEDWDTLGWEELIDFDGWVDKEEAAARANGTVMMFQFVQIKHDGDTTIIMHGSDKFGIFPILAVYGEF